MSRWKAKKGDIYYYLSLDAAMQFTVDSRKHEDWFIDLMRVDCGNCFQTDKQAWTWAKKLNLAVKPILDVLSNK
jgi:hypothetical protein